MRDKILQLMKERGDLPPLPDILIKVQEIVNNPRSQLSDITKLIEVEPIMTARIMSIANSPYYLRGAGVVKSLNVAVSKLGMNEIVKIIYSIEVSRLFTENNVLDSAQFWRHSLAVGVFSQNLAIRLNRTKEEIDLAYLAGLLHDIGIMVFAFLIPDEYEEFLKSLLDKEAPLEIQEREKFGIDHGELGSLFIKHWWKLDERLLTAVGKHHFPFSIKEDKEIDCAKLINVANGIVSNQGLMNGVFCFYEVFKEGAWLDLGLSLEDAQEILESVEEAFQQVNTLLK